MNTKYVVLRYFNSNIYNITTTSARVFTNYYIMFSSEKEYPKLFMRMLHLEIIKHNLQTPR